MKALQNFVSQFGLGISKEQLVRKAYFHMVANGYDACILNEKYIIIDGEEYQLIKSRKNGWTVKAF